jgi:hypothetical protein
MGVYIWNPLPLFEARQINTVEDGEAWVASLTDNELRNDHDGVVFSDVQVVVPSNMEGDRFAVRWVRTDTADGSQQYSMDAPIGGYAYASKSGQVGLWAEPEQEFLRRFQPYPVPTE